MTGLITIKHIFINSQILNTSINVIHLLIYDNIDTHIQTKYEMWFGIIIVNAKLLLEIFYRYSAVLDIYFTVSLPFEVLWDQQPLCGNLKFCVQITIS